jgi:exopolyphosphatase/guanosine-5'-triphosphate,3'-diphosphate pyrophosphatase
VLRASIDIGTNSTLLLIADVDGRSLSRVLDRAVVTRLGAGVDATRALSPEAIARTLEVLRDYASELRSRGVTSLRAVATSAVRDATNRDDFLLPARALLGVDVETLSGEEEARATFRGALLGLTLDAGAPVITFDIGGGSTEVIVGRVGDRDPRSARSIDIGAVRLTERHLRADPPTENDLLALRVAADRALATLGASPMEHTLVGLAGTVTTLAAVHEAVVPYAHERIHGMRLARPVVDLLADRLTSLPLADRRAVPGLDPRRADVIVAGVVIVQAVMDWAGASAFVVSDGGVRVGLLAE